MKQKIQHQGIKGEIWDWPCWQVAFTGEYLAVPADGAWGAKGCQLVVGLGGSSWCLDVMITEIFSNLGFYYLAFAKLYLKYHVQFWSPFYWNARGMPTHSSQKGTWAWLCYLHPLKTFRIELGKALSGLLGLRSALLWQVWSEWLPEVLSDLFIPPVIPNIANHADLNHLNKIWLNPFKIQVTNECLRDSISWILEPNWANEATSSLKISD